MNNSDPVYTKENNKVEINDRKINNNLNSNAMQNNYGPFAYGNFNNDLGNFVNSTKTTPN